LSKEVTANSVTGHQNVFLLLLDLDLIVFVVIVLLASKSRTVSVTVAELQLHFAWAGFKKQVLCQPGCRCRDFRGLAAGGWPESGAGGAAAARFVKNSDSIAAPEISRFAKNAR
jgi:hypothetical protein